MRLSYDLDGIAQVNHMLLGMETRLTETRPLLENFANTLEDIMAERFAAQGEGDWPPLAPSTVEKKGSSTIGRETDAMMASLTSSGSEGAIREFFGDEFTFGTSLTDEDGTPYPAIFDSGRSGQPARPLFDIAGMDVRRLTMATQAYLMGADRSAFGVGSFGMGLTEPFGV